MSPQTASMNERAQQPIFLQCQHGNLFIFGQVFLRGLCGSARFLSPFGGEEKVRAETRRAQRGGRHALKTYSPAWIGHTGNPAKSSQIVLMNIVFGNKAAGRRPAVHREEFTHQGCHSLKNTPLTTPTGLENRSQSKVMQGNPR